MLNIFINISLLNEGMSEVQNHGFVFENWIKKVLGVNKLATNYTQKWDVPGETPVSVKFMGLTNALEFGSTVRIWEINESFSTRML